MKRSQVILDGGYTYSQPTNKDLGSLVPPGTGHVFRGLIFMDPRTKKALWAMQLEVTNEHYLVFRSYVRANANDTSDTRYAMNPRSYENVIG